MDFMKQSFSAQSKAVSYDKGLREYMVGVFGNMCLALIITGLVSFLLGYRPELMALFYTQTAKGGIGLSGLGWIATFAPIVFILLFNYKIQSMSTNTARVMLWLYSALLGISLSPLFLMYTGESVAKIFFITSSLFAAMCIYGYTTKRDLTSFGAFFFMGLIGVLLASLVNMFLQSPAIEFVVSIITVLVFTGLTAYDVQRITNIYYGVPASEMRDKAAVLGALSLYMNFINLFIAMLKLFGNRKH